jgi:hypothetical protein
VRTYIEHRSVKNCFYSEKATKNLFSSGVFVVKVTIQVASQVTQETIFWSIRFNMCQLIYLHSHKKYIFPKQNEITNGLKYHTKKVDQQKKKLKEKPNTPKKANTGSTKIPLLIAMQLYKKKKMELSSRKPVLTTRQNLLQSI